MSRWKLKHSTMQLIALSKNLYHYLKSTNHSTFAILLPLL